VWGQGPEGSAVPQMDGCKLCNSTSPSTYLHGLHRDNLTLFLTANICLGFGVVSFMPWTSQLHSDIYWKCILQFWNICFRNGAIVLKSCFFPSCACTYAWICTSFYVAFNPLNGELNPICHLLALLEVHFLHVNRIRVKSLTLRLLMSYIYGAPILDVSRSHTTTHHSL